MALARQHSARVVHEDLRDLEQMHDVSRLNLLLATTLPPAWDRRSRSAACAYSCRDRTKASSGGPLRSSDSTSATGWRGSGQPRSGRGASSGSSTSGADRGWMIPGVASRTWLPGSSEVLSPFEDTDGREIDRTLPSLKHYPAPFTVLSQLLTCTRSYLGACR